MTIDDVTEIGQAALLVTLLASAPMLLSGMIVGLIISVFQSVTQIQEITLTFVPKIVVVMLFFVLFMPWMMDVVLSFVEPLFRDIHLMVR
jgi:flagellar biosynthetic protein FliQ